MQINQYIPLSSPPEKRNLFYIYISHTAQKVSICLERQQGVTNNKLYNAKG